MYTMVLRLYYVIYYTVVIFFGNSRLLPLTIVLLLPMVKLVICIVEVNDCCVHSVVVLPRQFDYEIYGYTFVPIIYELEMLHYTY